MRGELLVGLVAPLPAPIAFLTYGALEAPDRAGTSTTRSSSALAPCLAVLRCLRKRRRPFLSFALLVTRP